MDLTAMVSASYVLVAGGIPLLVALFALSRRGARLGAITVQAGDDILGGLLFALIFPAGIIAGAGHYILQANTGYYGTPGDFRNSATFVGICWLFIDVVAPVLAVLGISLLGSAAYRRWRAHRRREAPASRESER